MNERPHATYDKVKAWEDYADEILNQPVVPIEEALQAAVINKRMSLEEAQACLDAYNHAVRGEPL